ncbi:MAG: hypothetical protein KBF47_14635 [Gemmatimonadales bacterium]|nr:hypothetical protein [Gemmatimonadales bacterium]
MPARPDHPRARRGAGRLFLLLLAAACSLDPPSAPPDPTAPDPTYLRGVVLSAAGPTPVSQVYLRGRNGAGRTVITDDQGRFEARVDDLEPPYLLQTADAGSGALIHAVALDTGAVQLHLLTELQALWALGAAPMQWFQDSTAVQGANATLAQLTPAALAAARQQVTLLLSEQYGITAPDLDWMTAPVDPVSGDPLFDAIVALGAVFDPFSFEPPLVREAQRCKFERAEVVTPAAARQHCPYQKFTAPDPLDPAVTIFGFVNEREDSLLVLAGGAAGPEVRWQRAGEEAYTCAGAGCAVTIGGVTPDGTRPIALDGAALLRASDGDPATLAGTLVAADTGVQPPVLICGADRLVARRADQTFLQGCVAGASTSPMYPDRLYQEIVASDGVHALALSIIHADAQPLSVTLQDPQTGELFHCAAPGCAGLTLGPPDSAGRRTVGVAGLVLSGVLPGGLPSGTGDVVLSGTAVARSVAPPSFPVDVCTVATDTLVATVRGARDRRLCIQPPEIRFDDQVGKLWLDDGQGGQQWFLPGDALVQVATDAQGTVTAATLSLWSDTWACTGGACTGIARTPFDSLQRATLDFSGASFEELEPNFTGIPTGRTLTLDGQVRDIPPYGCVPGFNCVRGRSPRAGGSR